MNETEIRDRVREALGDASYPPYLPQRVAGALVEPTRRAGSALPALIAAVLMLLLIGTFVYVRYQSSSTPSPAVPPGTSLGPRFPMIAYPPIPKADLDQADMSGLGDLVTPLNLTSTRNGRALTLVGAYADSSRTVLFLRTMPEPTAPVVAIYDDSGLLSAPASGGRGIIGDRIFVLHAGPRPGSDGMAHLKVSIEIVDGPSAPGGQGKEGSWLFDFALRVPASIHLRPAPPLTTVGNWSFTVEAFEVTASEVHFQAVIDGAAIKDIRSTTFALTNTQRASLPLLHSDVTDAAPGTRVDMTWRRPALSDDYFLVVNGKDQGWVLIPGTVNPSYVPKGGPPLVPASFPAAKENMTFQGAFSATITDGRPSSCGIGAGSDGQIFVFDMWFQAGGDWYLIDLSTDPTVRQYTGPGTYEIRAAVWPLDGGDLFDGAVRLTVKSDRYPGPYSGTVSGSLTWTGAATQPYTVTISGSWTCSPGAQLGPG